MVGTDGPARGSHRRGPSPAGPHILIVDDDRPLADALRMLFADEGYTVSVAHDGAAALELLARESTDVVLTDVQMPVVDGLTLLGQIRARGLGVPVVLMSAGHLPVEAGAPFFVKPFDADALLDMVARCLQDGAR